MPGTFSVGGLASGLDTQNILDQLIALERRPVVLLENRQKQYSERLNVWKQVNSKLQALKSTMDEIRQTADFNLFSTNTEDDDIISLSATSSAAVGEHSIVVSSLAQARKISSNSFSGKTDALSLSGDFLINHSAISVSASDSLIDIIDKINNSNADVTASILQLADEEYRLIISSNSEGEDSFHILDASSSDILQNLGLTTGNVSLKNSITGGVESDSFTNITTTVGGVLSIGTPQSGTVTINDTSVFMDLANQTLSQIRDNINIASPTGVVASIVSTTEDGNTVYKLRIEGTTTFVDDNNILQTLGVLEGETGSAAVAQVATSSRVNTTDGTTTITTSTQFGQIYGASVTNGDTITIAGVDHDGGTVLSTFTITDINSTTVQDLLTAIESAFSNNVTASVNSAGKIVITDDVAGNSQFDFNLIENNEGSGFINFGTFSISTTGSEAISGDVQSGQDASLTVDGVSVTRDSNSITDILSGVTLNLHQADSLSSVNISVNRDYSAIEDKVENFIAKYNDIAEFINQQFTYNEDTETAGTLFGDSTLISVQSEIRNMISNRITGLPQDLRSLAQIGIDSDRNGILSLSSSKFEEIIQEDFDGVVKLFAATGETTDTDFSYITHSKDTNPGSYGVSITQAAIQASVTGTTNLYTGISDSEILTFTDQSTGQTSSVSLSSGEDIDAIVSKINTELSQEYHQIRMATGALQTGGLAATAFTEWTSMDGNASEGDTFTITGTRNDGDSVSGTYTISSGDTVQDLLSEIQTIFGSSVTATIDTSGKIVVTDVDTGTSHLDISIAANNEGGGTIDLGAMDLSQPGRYQIAITASNENGFLKLTHDDYGSGNGFSISQSANFLGIVDGSFSGQDVAGTINGESATGSGQFLAGDSEQANISGLVLRVTLTNDQLTEQGSSQGTLNLTMGVAEQLYNQLLTITDQYSGYVAQREDNLQNTIDDIQDRIELMEIRVAKKQNNLEMQFLNLERSMAQLSSLGNYLASQLAGF